MANRTDAVDRSKANTGRRCDHEILWPPPDTVKWTREHVPIVFFTILSDPPCALQDPETGGIVQAEVRFEWPNSILVRIVDALAKRSVVIQVLMGGSVSHHLMIIT